MQEREVWGAGSFAGYVHDHIAKTIGQLDTKVQILTGLTTAALAYEVQCLAALRTSMGLAEGYANSDLLVAAPYVAGTIALAMLVLALGFAWWSLRPRMGKAKGSLVFFSGVAAHATGDEYAAKSTAASASELIRAVSIDTFELAKIARRKSRWAQVGSDLFAFGLLALVFQLLAMLWNGQPLAW